MDFFQHRYYRTNKILMTTIGQWPYQTRRASRGYLALLLFLCTSQIVPQIIAFVKYRNEMEIVLECITPLILDAVCAVKLMNSIWKSRMMSMLLDRIRADWQVWSGDREVTVLHEYAEMGRKMTIVYAALSMLTHAVMIYTTGIVFLTQPVLPKVIDTLLRNGSAIGEFPFPVDYYRIDAQKYYFYIMMHSYVCVSMIILITVANDVMLIVYVLHGCGIFAALGCKLERMGKNATTAESQTTATELVKRDEDYEHLVYCIDRHNEAIEYAKLLEGTYSWCFFFVVGLNMLIISITGLQIVTRSNDPQETLRFIAFAGAQMVHLFVESYAAQILMDHSINIRNYIHNGKWYRISLRARKLLNFMTMRCNVPCKLTAGKICIMSVETFGVVLKTSASYFTLLRSMS